MRIAYNINAIKTGVFIPRTAHVLYTTRVDSWNAILLSLAENS
jgi:hypothetical protein